MMVPTHTGGCGATTTTRSSRSSNTMHASEQQTSDNVIHISNLDWFAPKEVVADQVGQIILPIFHHHHDIEGINPYTMTFKELPSRQKPRDQGKFHAGSATIAFDTVDDARRAWDCLHQYNNKNNNNKSSSLWRLRWAPLYNSFDKRPAQRQGDHTTTTLTPAVFVHRRKRAARYARRRQRVAVATDTLIDAVQQAILSDDAKNQNMAEILQSSHEVLQAPPFDTEWETSCPRAVDPVQGLQRGDRGLRKRAAVEAFVYVLQQAFLLPLPDNKTVLEGENKDDSLSLSPPVIADLGCGTGNLALPLAWWLSSSRSFRSCRLRAVDIKQESLFLLMERAESIGLTSVETLHANLATMMAAVDTNDTGTTSLSLSDCTAVVSLHACGVASDLSLAIAVSHNLPFAISPCCIGKVKKREKVNDEEELISYPRSKWLREILNQTKDGKADSDSILEDYELLASAADYAGNSEILIDKDPASITSPASFGEYLEHQSILSTNPESARRQRCQAAKRIIELDRLQWAVETRDYEVRLLELPRLGPNYAKRQLLLGAPAGSTAARKMMQLATGYSTNLHCERKI